MIKDEQGFTIVEVVVVIGIFALLMVVILNLLVWNQRLFGLHQSETQTTGSARSVMNSLERYVAQTSQIQTSRTISGVTYTTDADTLVLQIPAYDSSGTLITSTYDYAVYNLSGTALTHILETAGSSDRNNRTVQLSDTVKTLSFTYNNADVTQASTVTIDLQTETEAGRLGPAAAHLTGVIYLRNR